MEIPQENIIMSDDLTSGGIDVDRTFELYVKPKFRLKEVGFNLPLSPIRKSCMKEVTRMRDQLQGEKTFRPMGMLVIRLQRHRQQMYTKLNRRI